MKKTIRYTTRRPGNENSRPVKLWAVVLCAVLAFAQPVGLFAAADGSAAYKDTADQLAATEATKTLFTLEQVRSESRSRGAESKKAQSELVTAQAN